jgi:hypothetical protein
MKGWQRFLLLGVPLFAVNVVTRIVVSANQRAKLYPVDADSIGLPIYVTLLASVLTMLPLSVIAFVPGCRRVVNLCERGTAWIVAVCALLVVMYLLVGLFAVVGFAYWAGPDHYVISSTYAGLLVVVGALFLIDAWGVRRGTLMKADRVIR